MGKWRGRVPVAFAAVRVPGRCRRVHFSGGDVANTWRALGKSLLQLFGNEALQVALTYVQYNNSKLTRSSTAAWLGRGYVLWNLLQRLEGSASGGDGG